MLYSPKNETGRTDMSIIPERKQEVKQIIESLGMTFDEKVFHELEAIQIQADCIDNLTKLLHKKIHRGFYLSKRQVLPRLSLGDVLKALEKDNSRILDDMIQFLKQSNSQGKKHDE